MEQRNSGEQGKTGKIKRKTNSLEASGTRNVGITVNGKLYDLMIGKDIDASDTLARTLRETLGYTGTKIACDHGSCGACTVIMDGEAILSCMTLTVECDGKKVTTIEGLANEKTGEMDPLQQAFIDHTAFQCGFCTPGIIMSSKALLQSNPSPTEDEIKQELAGHYCRCGSQYLVIKAIQSITEKGR